MAEKRASGFSSQQARRLKDLGLTSRHIDALAMHALPVIRRHLHPPPMQDIKELLQNLASAASALRQAILAIRNPGHPGAAMCMPPPTAEFEDELRQHWAAKTACGKAAMNWVTEAWVEAIGKGTMPQPELDAQTGDITTPTAWLDQLRSESGHVESLVSAALGQMPSQVRKPIGSRVPVLEIWCVIDRTNRNIFAERALADQNRRRRPPVGRLTSPTQQGSRFAEVVEVCYEAAGYARRPKKALLAAQRSLKTRKDGAD